MLYKQQTATKSIESHRDKILTKRISAIAKLSEKLREKRSVAKATAARRNEENAKYRTILKLADAIRDSSEDSVSAWESLKPLLLSRIHGSNVIAARKSGKLLHELSFLCRSIVAAPAQPPAIGVPLGAAPLASIDWATIDYSKPLRVASLFDGYSG